MSYAGFRDTRRISELTKQDPSFRSLRLFAKQLKFTIDLPGRHRNSKPKLIADLIPNSGEVTFDKHGEEITVAVSLLHHFVYARQRLNAAARIQDHFFRTYQITVPPKTLGIKTKSGSVFPIIVCYSIEQLFRVRPLCRLLQYSCKET